MPGAPDGFTDAEELSCVCVRAWNELTVLGAVQRRAAGAESERACASRALDVCGHRGDVVVGGDLVRGAALAHHVRAERSVGDLRPDVDDTRPGL